ncbi:MAG: CPBP family glutamic-type intramembrane protease, partial [Minicystis sp.]
TVAFGTALSLRAHLDPWLATAAAAALATAAAALALGRARLAALFARDAREAAGAALLGIVLVGATHLAFRLVPASLAHHVAGLYASIDVATPRAARAALTLAVVVAEELVWRGCALALASAPRPASAALAVALYALPQLAGGEWLLLVAAVALGALFTAQRLRSGGLLAPLITHAIWSIAIFVLLPLVG